jgi:hypothetical protein
MQLAVSHYLRLSVIPVKFGNLARFDADFAEPLVV